jgi:hypothetical protein
VPVNTESLGHDPVSEIDGVKPRVLVGPRLEFLCVHSVRVVEPQAPRRVERRVPEWMDIS